MSEPESIKLMSAKTSNTLLPIPNGDFPWVSANGVVYKSRDIAGERRKMDCIDCHNRPTHAFDMPATAVDTALESGELDRTIPYVKRDAVLQLTGKKPIEEAQPAVKRIYARNIFPE